MGEPSPIELVHLTATERHRPRKAPALRPRDPGAPTPPARAAWVPDANPGVRNIVRMGELSPTRELAPLDFADEVTNGD